jgi:hypothetical protein
MIEWCHRHLKDENWDYQTHPHPMLGDETMAVRFYFASAVEAAAFGKKWLSKRAKWRSRPSKITKASL